MRGLVVRGGGGGMERFLSRRPALTSMRVSPPGPSMFGWAQAIYPEHKGGSRFAPLFGRRRHSVRGARCASSRSVGRTLRCCAPGWLWHKLRSALCLPRPAQAPLHASYRGRCRRPQSLKDVSGRRLFGAPILPHASLRSAETEQGDHTATQGLVARLSPPPSQTRLLRDDRRPPAHQRTAPTARGRRFWLTRRFGQSPASGTRALWVPLAFSGAFSLPPRRRDEGDEGDEGAEGVGG